MTKSEIEQKIAEVKAQGDALQKHNAQLMQQIEVNKVEIAKIIGKLDLLSEMLTDCEKQAAEPAKEEAIAPKTTLRCSLCLSRQSLRAQIAIAYILSRRSAITCKPSR